ncbi:hypothetical protein [Sphingomonas sp. UYP23]
MLRPVARAELSLSIRGNGIRIDPRFPEEGGRQGHFGLIAMQERAEQINAALNISSRPGAGTELTLFIPGQVAYVTRRKGGWRDWLKLRYLTE